jgi:hypothetical protein
MNDPLTSHIESMRRIPGASTELRERLGQLPGVSTQAQLDQCEQAVNGAVDAIPHIIRQMAAAGQQSGIGHLLTPILQQVTDYFLTQDDLIPDSRGNLGLLDDAYLAHLYLQEINRAYKMSTGSLLLGIDCSGTIAVLRVILGPQITAQLDQAVIQGVDQAMQRSEYQQLINRNQPLSPTGGAGAWGNSWEDEMSRVGAECGISINW